MRTILLLAPAILPAVLMAVVLAAQESEPLEKVLMALETGDYDFIKVLDFGLVSLKPSLAAANPTLTAKGHLVGTPAYMPPEMATGSSPVDARSDLYALGCVAYFLLTSEDPFAGKTVMDVVS